MSVTIDTMLNFDGDFNGHGDGGVTPKQTLTNMFQNKALVNSLLRGHLEW